MLHPSSTPGRQEKQVPMSPHDIDGNLCFWDVHTSAENVSEFLSCTTYIILTPGIKWKGFWYVQELFIGVKQANKEYVAHNE